MGRILVNPLVNLLADSCRGRREIFGRNFYEAEFLKWSGVWIASILAVSAVSAQINEVEQMRKELREMRERMQSLEQKLAASSKTCGGCANFGGDTGDYSRT